MKKLVILGGLALGLFLLAGCGGGAYHVGYSSGFHQRHHHHAHSHHGHHGHHGHHCRY